MTELPAVPKNADQVAGLIKKFAPPPVGMSIGFGVRNLPIALTLFLRRKIKIVDPEINQNAQG